MATHRMSIQSVLGLVWGAMIVFLAVGAAQAAPPNARIVSAEGTVQILAVPTGAWVAASSPATVPPGSAVRTGPKSKAVIDLDGAEVTLYETSLIRIPATAAPASTATNPLRHPWLDSGRALFDVTPRKDRAAFSVQTPTVVAGVKGTVFEVSSTGTEEAVYVWDGLVEVTSRLNATDIQLVAAGQFTMLDGLRLTPALPIPDNRDRPDEVNRHRHAVEAVAVEKPADHMTEDFSVSAPLDSTLATEAWRDADRAAVKSALDQSLDFQSVVSIGTVRSSTDSLSNTLTSTTTSVNNTTTTVTDPHTSTESLVTNSTVVAVDSTLTSTTSSLEPVLDPLASTTSTVTDSLRTLGF